MSTTDQQTFTCDTCGHQWQRGQHGGHDCLGRVVAQRDEALKKAAEPPDIGNVLSRDQCVNGFTHTADAIVLWLCGSTIEAGEILHRKIGENIADMKQCEAQVAAINSRYQR